MLIGQMTPFFSSTFRALIVGNIHFVFENTKKFTFMGSPLWTLFWSAKYTIVVKITSRWLFTIVILEPQTIYLLAI